MGHIQRRCARGHAVPAGRACPRCKSSDFSWRVRYVDPDGHERNRSFKRKADAELFHTEVSHTLRSGAYVDPSAGRITVQEYLERWRGEQAHHRRRTAESTRTRFRTMVYPFLGSKPIASVKPSTIRTWQATLLATEWKPGRTYSVTNITGVRGVVAGAFADAVRDRILASNPFDGVKTLDADKPKIVPRTIAQVRAGELLLPDHYRAIVPVDSGTGLRWGELFGLTVDRVDFLRRTLRVDRQLIGRAGKTPVFGPPKSSAGERSIPLPKRVVAALAAHLAKYPARPGPALYEELGGQRRPFQHDGLVFATGIGTPMTRTVWNRAWHPARDAMGLGEGEGLHHLRHFYASLLIADGRSVKEVQERLGHASAQETLDTYSHLWPGSDDGTRDAIDRAFAADDESGAAPKDDAASDE